MSKKNKYYLESWKNSNLTSLEQVYKTYSIAKAEAFDRCKHLCYERCGTTLRIISHSGWYFTAAFSFLESGVEKLMVITPTKEIIFEIGDE